MGIDWGKVAERLATLGGFWLFWWLRRKLGWEIAGAMLAGPVIAVLGWTTVHCYLRLRHSGLTRHSALRRCLEWVTN